MSLPAPASQLSRMQTLPGGCHTSPLDRLVSAGCQLGCLFAVQEALAYAYKGSGCEGNGGDLLVGMTSSTVALWDYMTKQGEAARTDNFRAYSKSPGFACIATGGDTGKPVGTVVAGCSDGAIKVFENGNLARVSVVVGVWPPHQWAYGLVKQNNFGSRS